MRKKFLLIISIVVLFALPLSGCKQNKKQNVYQAVKTSKTINWGVKMKLLAKLSEEWSTTFWHFLSEERSKNGKL